MKSDIYLKIGTLFFAITILAIGFIHLLTRNFPSGFLPVTLSFPGKTILIYLSGIVMICSGILILVKKYIKVGAILSAFYFLILVLVVHIPALAKNNPAEWTGTFEPLSLFSGLLILLGIVLKNEGGVNKGRNFVLIGCYLFATGLFVFGVVHIVYEKFVLTWIPGWIPFPVFWSYIVPMGFFAAFVSIVIRKYVRLSSLLLALMFFIWVLVINFPRALTLKFEPEWTGTFIALAMSGTGLLIASAVNYERKI